MEAMEEEEGAIMALLQVLLLFLNQMEIGMVEKD
jgi:hypothetical protein